MSEGQRYRRPGRAIASAAGGMATDAELFGASLEQMLLVDNTTAAGDALMRAYDDWRRDLKAATGQEPPPNPMVPVLPDFDAERAKAQLRGDFAVELEAQARDVERQRRDFQIWVNEQAARFPREATRDWSERNPDQAAEALARQADERLAELMASREGWDAWPAVLAGGVAGSLRDPLTIGSMAIGGGAGAARTVAGRILMTAATEAAVNAATEAAAQPFVQDWRRRAGLPHGLDAAAQNVLFAAALGGTLGAGGRALVEGAQALVRGDVSAALARLAPHRAGLPADARGAIDALETEAALAMPAPDVAAARRQADLETRAQLHAQNPTLQPARLDALAPDEAQVTRLVHALAPGEAMPDTPPASLLEELRNPAASIGPARRPVAEFLKRQGGIHPEARIAGDLRQAGVTPQAFPGLFSRNGLKEVDNIPHSELPPEFRFALAEDGNGYVSEQAFVDALAAEARATSDAVDAAGAQRRAYEAEGVDFAAPDEEALAAIARADDVGRRYREAPALDGLTRRERTAAAVREVLRLRPGSDDAFARDAAENVLEGATAEEAIRIAESNRAGVRVTDPPSPFDDAPREPPDLAEIEAALSLAPRSGEDANRLGDPGAIDFKALEEAGFGADARIPWEDGEISLEALQRELEETAFLERVVQACKVG